VILCIFSFRKEQENKVWWCTCSQALRMMRQEHLLSSGVQKHSGQHGENLSQNTKQNKQKAQE
jgi:hypothetical protein